MSDAATRHLACDHCGRVTTCTLCPSPYIDKRWPDDPDERSWWCPTCLAAEQADADAYQPPPSSPFQENQ